MNVVPVFFLLVVASITTSVIAQASDAKRVCPANEFLRGCANKCEGTCANPNPICTAICQIGSVCACNSGYVRDNGVCILAAKCPQICPKHEVFAACGPRCEPTCANPKPTICSDLCPLNGGCTCQSGYVRQNGVCILAANCPVCPKHEVFFACGPGCEPTCANPKPQICPYACLLNGGCGCASGYVRQGKICIRYCECPDQSCVVAV